MAYSTALEEEEEAGWQCCMPPRGQFWGAVPMRWCGHMADPNCSGSSYMRMYDDPQGQVDPLPT